MNGYANVWYQARLYVFFHEMYHVFYKNDPRSYREIITTIQAICRIIIETGRQQYLFVNDLDETTKEIQRKAFTSIIEETDNRFLEEIACDFQSFITIHTILEPIYEEKHDIIGVQTTINDVQETMRLCINFQTEVTYVLSVWIETIESARKKMSSKKHSLINADDEVTEFQKNIDYHKTRAFIRNAVFFQIIQTRCLLKYNEYSKLNDVLSNRNIRKYLFPISEDLINPDYMNAKLLQGITFQMKSNLTPSQQIECRDMLVSLNKTMVVNNFTEIIKRSRCGG
jgi:hypothetical protein